ncbi:MAG: tRNA adenosine(34) deaminase TadA [Coriobacteriia bacterium]|nr:tRNA adenosine(34) deaminase TadA [Coriobacteriia bacterium]
MDDVNYMSRTQQDEHFMSLALDAAREAFVWGEVPVGALVVMGTEVVSTAFNRRETDADPSAHAEFIAIVEAARKLKRWRLGDCTVFVTLEPCLMCAGLMVQARIKRCVFGAPDQKAGAFGSIYELQDDHRLNHTIAITSAVLEEESRALLQKFFSGLRNLEDNAT